jgi:4'-phosphopantetheinyl transferase EntD
VRFRLAERSGRYARFPSANEPNETLPDGVLTAIAIDKEILSLNNLPFNYPNWNRLFSSAKESFYKARFAKKDIVQKLRHFLVVGRYSTQRGNILASLNIPREIGRDGGLPENANE